MCLLAVAIAGGYQRNDLKQFQSQKCNYVLVNMNPITVFMFKIVFMMQTDDMTSTVY